MNLELSSSMINERKKQKNNDNNQNGMLLMPTKRVKLRLLRL